MHSGHTSLHSTHDSFCISNGTEGDKSRKMIGTWIYGEQSMKKESDGFDGPLPLEEVKTSLCLYFTPKFYTGCCCCLHRNIEEGDVVELYLNEDMTDIADTAPSSTEFPSPAEVVHVHQNKSIDLILEDGFRIDRVSRSSILRISRRSNDEYHTGCGCVLLQKLELNWDFHQQSRAKVRFRAGTLIFLLINIAMAILDGIELRDAENVKTWATAPFFGTSSYTNNPFCEIRQNVMNSNIR
tara:strand:- start:255 stop:974 length:720 start_codon:yes stop_codon:yes gene_type:complete